MHSISHRFPIWDKQDKHCALLLQEHKAPSSFLSCCGSWAPVAHNAPCPAGKLHKVRKPWLRGVCWPSWPCPYGWGPSHPAAVWGPGELLLSVLGETREAFNWISLLFLDCCDTGRTEVCFRVWVAWFSVPHLCFSRDTPATEIFGLGMAPLEQGENLCLQEQRAAEMLPVCSTLCCTSMGWMVQRGKE